MKEKRIELLSPAGDIQRLNMALKFGADAVYVGGDLFGMRAGANNFSLQELQNACTLAHQYKRKLYLTCNTLPRNDEIEALPQFLIDAQSCGVDAFIIADIGVLALAKQYAPDVEVHISTQAGIVNFESANAFYDMGASRVVLARELSFVEIKTIREKTNPALEIECFVHGAMCMSFSGRCLLSDYMIGRDANRGDCAQPCRWKYHLMEETRPGEFFSIEENNHGSYILNSRDLCMIKHIAQLDAAGIDSFKIEGRAKSEYYTAVTTFAYRNAIDSYLKDPSTTHTTEAWVVAELNKISHREYTTGFYFGPIEKGQVYPTSGYLRDWEVVAVFESQGNGILTVSQRNRFYLNDELEVLEPNKKPYKIKVCDLYNDKNEPIEVANQATRKVHFTCDMLISTDAIFRKEKTE